MSDHDAVEQVITMAWRAHRSDLSTFEGQVTEVDLDGVAFDGLAIVRAINGSGEEQVVSIPSMGLRLCKAYEQLADVFAVSVGDHVSVAGARSDDGRIVPCGSEEHYLTVEDTVADPSVELSFLYRKGPDGCVLDTPARARIPTLRSSHSSRSSGEKTTSAWREDLSLLGSVPRGRVGDSQRLQVSSGVGCLYTGEVGNSSRPTFVWACGPTSRLVALFAVS